MGLFSDIYIFMKSLLDLKVQRGLFVAKLLHEIYATGIVCTNPSCYHRAGIKSRSAKYGDQARSCYKILWRKAGDPDDKLESYTPENADLIVDGWLDDDSVLFGYSASAVGVIYNTTVFSTLDADWKDLGNAEYKDQLAIPDPEKSGACKDFVAGYVVKNGWDDFQAMADNGMTVPGANKAALEAVTTGEVGILVAGVDYNAYSSKNKGEPLDIYYPAGGTIVNPRPAMILKTAPNMDNAKAFVDYLFSDEAQQLVANAYLLPGRTDIKCDKRSNLEDIPQITPDWDKMMAEASDDAAKINQICGASNG